MKRLTKSRTNRVMDGVLGGIGEYFNIDPVIIRIIFVIFTLTTAFMGGFIAYIIAMMIMPEGDRNRSKWEDEDPIDDRWDESSERPFHTQTSTTRSHNSRNGALWLGTVFIIIGAMLLINNLLEINLWDFVKRYSEYLWGIGLAALGIIMIVAGGRRK